MRYGRYDWRNTTLGETSAIIRRYAPTVNDDGDFEFALDEPEVVASYAVTGLHGARYGAGAAQRELVETWARQALDAAAKEHPTYYVDGWLTRYEFDELGEAWPVAHALFAVGDQQFEWYHA